MKTKILILLVALAATVPAVAQPPPPAPPKVIITVEYTPDTPPGRQHLFYGWCEYLRYFAPFFRPCWP